MTRQVRCPACDRIVPLNDPEAGPQVRCEACGARVLAAAGSADRSPGRPSSRRRKRGKKGSRAPLGGPWVWLAAGGAVGLAGILLVIGLVTAGLSGPAGIVGPPDAAAPAGAGVLVVIDAPVEPLRPAAVPPAPKAPPAPRREAPRRAAPPTAAAARPAGPWNARPARAAAPPPAVAPDLALNFTGPPLFAARGGPFAIDVPVLYGRLGHKVERVGGGVRITEVPQPPIPVLDLRTGKPAGEFPWKAPAWLGGCLSPDGVYLVGADTAVGSPATEHEGQILVWKRGAGEPAARFSLTRAVSWADFVAPDRLAVLALVPRAILQVWDVAKGQCVQAVPLDPEDFPPSSVPPFKGVREKLTYSPYPFHGAVSPGGRYVALGGRRGIVLVSLADNRPAGTLPLPGPRERLDYRGLSFAPDGGELFAVIDFHGKGGLRLRLLSWSMADGSPRVEAALLDELLCGPPLPGPAPGTLIVPLRAQLRPGIDPGQWQRLQYNPGAVVETTSGAVLMDLEAPAARWVAPGRLLVSGTPAGAAGRVRVVALDAKTLGDRAGPALAALAPRPPVRPADRAAVKVVRPEPAGWAVPVPAGRAAPAAAAALPAWPAAFGDTEAALLTSETVMKPAPRVELRWQRFDLGTGRPLAGPVVLWPTSTKPGAPAAEAVAALTADGKRLAVRDPADLARLDVWDDAGTRLLGLAPGGAIDWLGWSGDGRLLTLAAGKLTGWEVPAARAVYEVDGGYTGPAGWAPGRAWLALATGDHADILDAATGRCLGRCRAGGAVEESYGWSLSPDGRLLVRTCPGGLADPKDAQYGRRVAAQVWDLTTGKEAAPVQFGRAPARVLHWCGPRQFLVLSAFPELIDVDARAAVCRYRFPRAVPPDRQAEALRSDPAGRLWGQAAGAWRPLAVPDPKGPDGLLARPGRTYPFHPGVTVRVEVDLGDRERSGRAARRLAALLQAEGFVIGPGGWALRLGEAEGRGHRRLPRFEGDKEGTPIPQIRATWQLLAPDGTPAWKNEEWRNFDLGRSKYVTQRKTVAVGGLERVERISYDFRGQDPHAAMLGEVLDNLANEGRLPRGMPPALLRDGGGYQPLPLEADLPLAAAP